MWRGECLPRVGVVVLLASLLATGGAAVGSLTSKVSPVLGADFLISGPGATDEEWCPAVVWNGTDNEYLVVWTDLRPWSGMDVYGRRVRADGVALGSDFRISGAGATSGEDFPAVAWNEGADQYLVVWHDWRNSTSGGADIYARRVSPAGVPVGGDIRITSLNASPQHSSEPTVVWNAAANEYLVVWSDERNEATRGYDIYGRRVGPDGARLGRDFRISGTGGVRNEWSPKVVWNGTANQYLVVWMDGRNHTFGFDVYGRRVGPDGVRLGRDFRINGTGAVTSGGPVAAWNGSENEYLVVWEDGRNYDTRERDIYGRRVGPDGVRHGGDFRISGGLATAEEETAAVAWNATDDEYLVVWDDHRNLDTRASDIYGRLVRGGQ